MDVIGTHEFADWYAKLPEDEACAVTKAVSILETVGPDAENVRELEFPPMLHRRQGLAVPHPPPFVVPPSLRELSVPERPCRVLFAVEPNEKIVLLYGYDASVERVAMRRDLPPVAHILLAARVYGNYKKEVA